MTKTIKYCPIQTFKDKSFSFEHVHIRWNEQVVHHQQETWELSYVITGGGTRLIGNTMETFAQGEVILIPPHIPHCWSFDEFVSDKHGKIENITITFPHSLLDTLKSSFPELAIPLSEIINLKHAISFSGSTLKQLQNEMWKMISQSDIERLSSFIRLIILVSSDKTSSIVGKPIFEDKKTEKTQRIYMYVLNNFQNEIKLDDVAQLVNLDKSSFCIFFKKMTGQSFFTFLAEYRIRASCQMLKNTTLSIAEICFASGFRDVPYYNRVFKRLQKETPSQYRSNIKDQ